ncbi:hypothetical protein TwortDSMZ_192 [Staphylococcus phage Twort]|uniref:Uncharacterized protein n=2 Tax=Staphylococcus phage Twort (strain DSM 17442 / HER 48) TaxID=2908167 RepID=A0A6H0X5J0_BPTWO|nr:ORF075 [Staphylococcus phage Twort]AAX92369.1 ORF075 [Staphylococcus phage Twort]QIW89017.1 hypothetical protein TwortDSMZ_003 [Staphylococcus phage Twort]QIW89188.1 hypothetical protein TwortDSMZ_192 [Staphylococcus phage Twort]
MVNKNLSESITKEVKDKLHELVDNLDIEVEYKFNHAGSVEVDVKFDIKEKPFTLDRDIPVINTAYSKLIGTLEEDNKKLMGNIIEENKKKYPKELDKYDLSKYNFEFNDIDKDTREDTRTVYIRFNDGRVLPIFLEDLIFYLSISKEGDTLSFNYEDVDIVELMG